MSFLAQLLTYKMDNTEFLTLPLEKLKMSILKYSMSTRIKKNCKLEDLLLQLHLLIVLNPKTIKFLELNLTKTYLKASKKFLNSLILQEITSILETKILMMFIPF